VERGFRETRLTYGARTAPCAPRTPRSPARNCGPAYLIVYQARLIICHAALRRRNLEPARTFFTAARDAVRNSTATTP
jgi:hypothetical protein